LFNFRLASPVQKEVQAPETPTLQLAACHLFGRRAIDDRHDAQLGGQQEATPKRYQQRLESTKSQLFLPSLQYSRIPADHLREMNLSGASAILFGTSCASFSVSQADAFIFGHQHRHQPASATAAPLRINANLGRKVSASQHRSQNSAREALQYKPSENGDDVGDDNDNENSARQGKNSDEKDTVSASINDAADAPNSHIVDDVDCYDLCDAFDEDNVNEDSKVVGERLNSDAPVSASPKDAPVDVPASSTQSSSPSAEPEESARSAKDVKTMRQNLELHWQITSSSSECDVEDIRSCSDPCPTCHGTGRVECRFCGGTGFFTLGEVVIGGGKACPICNHDGEEECAQCRGSGWVANWKQTNLTGLEP